MTDGAGITDDIVGGPVDDPTDGPVDDPTDGPVDGAGIAGSMEC